MKNLSPLTIREMITFDIFMRESISRYGVKPEIHPYLLRMGKGQRVLTRKKKAGLKSPIFLRRFSQG